MSLFPINDLTPITYAGPPPNRADVVVIGGGVIGVCTALFLAQRGRRVVLLEKGRIAGEQSSRNWGWIRQTGRDLDELPIMAEANRLWRELAAQAPNQIQLVQGGIAYLAHGNRQMAGYEQWLSDAKGLGQGPGIDSEILSGTQVARLIPGMPKRYAGALYTASDMRAEPWTAVPALAAMAARDGAHLVENCAVRALDVQAGRVAGVVTEAGRIAAPEVVLAGGAWSSLLLQNAGLRLPQLSVRATVAATHPLPQPYAGAQATNTLRFGRGRMGGIPLRLGALANCSSARTRCALHRNTCVNWPAIPLACGFCPLLRAAIPMGGARRAAGMRIRARPLRTCAS
jgi:glycine/D-amino acid oxidase-like deaminating enzyme